MDTKAEKTGAALSQERGRLMDINVLPVTGLTETTWNPNKMDTVTMHKLRESILRFGLVGNLVVRLLPSPMSYKGIASDRPV